MGLAMPVPMIVSFSKLIFGGVDRQGTWQGNTCYQLALIFKYAPNLPFSRFSYELGQNGSRCMSADDDCT